MEESTVSTLKRIAQKIYEKKGSNILAIDIREISMLTDYFLIAQGNVERHVQALSQEIQAFLKEEGMSPYRIEGQEEGDWIVLDYADFMVHLFIPEMRERYRLEHVWSFGKLIDLSIVVEEEQKFQDRWKRG